MLEQLLGNKSAGLVLLNIFHYGENHASGIARDCNVAVTPIRLQLERFETADLLISKQIGRARVYQFNPKSPYIRPLKDMIRIEYESISSAERQRMFRTRRRPRRKGKPVT